ncbi:acetyltransferase [Chitinispirillum alkaliphilum]|nr:acetyltransferase [Chitinispirillum alkaliphilum]
MNSLYRLRKREISKAGDVLADAFLNDPVWTKAFEGEADFDKKFKSFSETPLRYALKYGEVYASSECLEGVAALVPGHLAEMTPWRMLLSSSMITGIRMGSVASKRLMPLWLVMSHHRKEITAGKDFLYLMIIGVASKFQKQGYGKKLLNSIIRKSESEGKMIYLETETEENVAIYEKFGFEVVKKFTVPIFELPMWIMIRQPRG